MSDCKGQAGYSRHSLPLANYRRPIQMLPLMRQPKVKQWPKTTRITREIVVSDG